MQMDRIPITEGIVSVVFVSRQNDIMQGVALGSKSGGIFLSDGSVVARVNIWDEVTLPRTVQHRVKCRDGELKIWNIYKATRDDDRTRADAWTNNAGMVVEVVSDTRRRYRCSDGIGAFDPNDFVFELVLEPT